MKAGIWLAPFVAEAKSALFRENPFWFCKDNNGDFIKCGSNWSGFYALNLKNSEVIDYIKKCLHFYVEMGFDFFKLDFLNAANVCNYEGKTRSQVAQKAYSLLRKNNIRLSEKQRIALSTINSLFGSLLMTSDNPKDYDEKQFLQLKEIFSLFQDAKNVDFETLENKIRITYEFKGERKVLIYDVKKGNLGKPVARIGAPAEGRPGV